LVVVSNLWDRWEGEPDDAWNAFRAYLDMPPDRRRIDKTSVARKETIGRWYRDFDWYKRVTAFDEQNEAIYTAELRREYLNKAAVEHARYTETQLSDMQELWDREIVKLLDSVRKSDQYILKVRDLLKLGEMKFKMERLLSGQTTENVGTTEIDYDNLSADELLKLNELMEKAIKKGAKVDE
jgi:hypothetical protein